jgi:hypothetical protein
LYPAITQLALKEKYMSKTYENECPWSSQAEVKMIRMIAILGDLWNPGLSDSIVCKLYEAVMNPNTPPIVIDFLSHGIDLTNGDSSDNSWNPQDRNQI